MPKKLDFSAIEEAEDVTLTKKESALQRWKSRDVDPTVQMSVRMHASEYDRFQMLRKRERRTNGEMLIRMMDLYEREQSVKMNTNKA